MALQSKFFHSFTRDGTLLNIQLDVGNYGVHHVQDERDRGWIRTLSFCVGDVGTRYLALQLMLFICV